MQIPSAGASRSNILKAASNADSPQRSSDSDFRRHNAAERSIGELSNGSETCIPHTEQTCSARILHHVPELKLNLFVRAFLILSAGTATAALVVILATPVLSRLYPPAAFGTLAVYTAALSLMTTIGAFRYELAIPIAETDEVAANLATVSFVLVVANVSIIIGAVALVPSRLLQLVHCPDLSSYLWLIPVAFLLTSVYQIASYWAIRRQGHRQLARTRISQSAGCTAAQLSIGAVHGGVWGLLLGDLIGRASGSGVMLRYLAASWPRGGVVARRRAWGAMRRYAKFPLLSAPAAVLGAAASQLPLLLLARFFGLEAAGFYALCARVLNAPTSLLGGALGQAFLSHAATLRLDNDELRRVTERLALALLSFGLPVFLFVMVEGPPLFAQVFGQRWLVAGIYAQRLAPWFLLWMVSSPLSQLLTVREWQGTTLVFTSVECAVTVCALSVGAWLKSAQVGVTALGIAGFILAILTTSRYLHAGYSSWRRLIINVVALAVCAAATFAAASMVTGGASLFGLGTRFALFASAYGLLVWRFRLYGRCAVETSRR